MARVFRTRAAALLILLALALGLPGAAGLLLAAQTSAAPPRPALELAGYHGGSFNSLALGDQIAYVGKGAQLLIFDIAQPGAPTPTARMTLGPLLRLQAAGATVYALTRSDLQIIDASDPSAPRLAGRYGDLPADSTDLVISGTLALLAADRDLLLLDIADPAAPALLSRQTLPARITNIALGGPRVYVGSVRGLFVLDISRPAAPSLLGVVDSTLTTYCITARGNLVFENAYPADPLPHILPASHLLDLSNPQQPVRIAGPPTYTCIRQIDRDLAYGMFYDSRPPVIYDFTNHSSMVQLSPDGAFLTDPIDLLVSNNRLLLITRDRLAIYDVSLPRQPELLGQYQATGDLLWGGKAAVAQGRAFVPALSGVDVLSATGALSLTLAAHIPLSGTLRALQASDSRLYVAQTDGTLAIVDIRDPDHAVPIGSAPFPAHWRLLYVDNTRVLANIWKAGEPEVLYILDVSDPAAPRLLGSYNVDDFVMDAQPYAGYIYLLKENRLELIDARNPQAISRVTQLEYGGRSIAISAARAYLAGNSLLTALDLRDPAAPRLLWQSAVFSSFFQHSLAVSGGRGYAISDRLRVFDLEAPGGPLLRASLPLAGDQVFLSQSMVYTLGADAGLVALRPHPELFPSPIYLPALRRG